MANDQQPTPRETWDAARAQLDQAAVDRQAAEAAWEVAREAERRAYYAASQPQITKGCTECGRAADLCALCDLLAYGLGPEPTPEQAEAIQAYMDADEGMDGPAYQRMVALGLPKWGQAHG